MRIRDWHLCTTALITCLGVAGAARGAVITVVDVIPNAASAETGQNSEPSLAVDPLNPNMMISGAFSSTFVGGQVTSPYWKSIDGGATWSGFGSLPSLDKSLAWRQDGVAALTTTLNLAGANTSIGTFQSQATNFGAAINTFNPGQNLDQPWIRTGASGQTYVAYNNLSNAGGRTASMIVSANNGTTYGGQVTLETVNPTGGQDAPSVRQAVNGSTVYAAFTRWGTPSGVTGGTIFSGSQVVVVKSTNSGGSFPTSVNAATTTGYFDTPGGPQNSPLSVGQERVASDVAIAVDPNNASRVVVAYGDRTGTGQLQLKVIESTDGGSTWSSSKFTTSSSVRSALPGLSILANGDVGLLYLSYDPIANTLSQHLVTTTNDFATTDDSVLGTETNSTPTLDFNPYLGDFYDLTSVGDTFDGIFSASNNDNGNTVTGAMYQSAIFQRAFTGTLGTANFQLKDLSNNNVNTSIDPFVFSFTLNNVVVPEPGTLTLLGASLLGLAALRRRRQ
jgi:hypothetical protein